jgi:hypothetical protein
MRRFIPSAAARGSLGVVIAMLTSLPATSAQAAVALIDSSAEGSSLILGGAGPDNVFEAAALRRHDPHRAVTVRAGIFVVHHFAFTDAEFIGLTPSKAGDSFQDAGLTASPFGSTLTIEWAGGHPSPAVSSPTARVRPASDAPLPLGAWAGLIALVAAGALATATRTGRAPGRCPSRSPALG